ncbi:MAG: hypothetical protein Kapaf2KO_19110 [Candidatus Kapaibacteriales bacterium]
MNKSFKIFLIIFSVLLFSKAKSEIILDAELSYTIPLYIDIGIPGDQGTRFEASEVSKPKDIFPFRGRLGWRSESGDHEIFALIAPLFAKYQGELPRDIVFQDETFRTASSAILGYKFNSYRLSYRYAVINWDDFKFRAGAAVKIRDAYIELSDGENTERKDDLGFVPLLTVMLQYDLNEDFSLLLDADGLASTQGRAFDVMTGLRYAVSDDLGVRLNYRFLDGGADNNEVYNFAFFNYISLGMDFKFYN